MTVAGACSLPGGGGVRASNGEGCQWGAWRGSQALASAPAGLCPEWVLSTSLPAKALWASLGLVQVSPEMNRLRLPQQTHWSNNPQAVGSKTSTRSLVPFSAVGRAGRGRLASLLDEDHDMPQTTWPPGALPTARPGASWSCPSSSSACLTRASQSSLRPARQGRSLWRVTSRVRATPCCPQPQGEVEKLLSLPAAPDPGAPGQALRVQLVWTVPLLDPCRAQSPLRAQVADNVITKLQTGQWPQLASDSTMSGDSGTTNSLSTALEAGRLLGGPFSGVRAVCSVTVEQGHSPVGCLGPVQRSVCHACDSSPASSLHLLVPRHCPHSVIQCNTSSSLLRAPLGDQDLWPCRASAWGARKHEAAPWTTGHSFLALGVRRTSPSYLALPPCL